MQTVHSPLSCLIIWCVVREARVYCPNIGLNLSDEEDQNDSSSDDVDTDIEDEDYVDDDQKEKKKKVTAKSSGAASSEKKTRRSTGTKAGGIRRNDRRKNVTITQEMFTPAKRVGYTSDPDYGGKTQYTGFSPRWVSYTPLW
jgi:hypothetical protein